MKKVLSLLLTVMLLFALAVPAMPVEFVPSAEAPELTGVITATDDNGNEVEVCVTISSDAEAAPSEEIAEQLVKAREELAQADNLADIVPELDDLMAGTAAKPEDLVVEQVFDMTLIDENGNPLVYPAGTIYTAKLKTDLTENDIFFVIHQTADGAWEVIPAKLEGGYIVIRVTSMSPFAIIKVGEIVEEPVVQPGTDIPASPQTGDSFPALYLVCALLCAGVAVVLFKKAGKKA